MAKAYLATTGISRIWDLDSKLFLLGPWCLTGRDSLRLLEGRPHDLIPSPFKPAVKIKEGADYCGVIYEELLPKLSERLNALHKVSYPLSYWKIILGYWLLLFIGIVYDRYQRLEHSFSLYPNLYTYALPYEQCNLATLDTYDLLSLNGKVNQDYYNLKLFSIILHNLYPDKLVEVKYKSSVVIEDRKESLKRWLFRFIINSLSISKGEVVLSDLSQLESFDSILLRGKIQPSKVVFKDFASRIAGQNREHSKNIRERLTLVSDSDQFRKMLYKILPSAIPASYIENYNLYQSRVKNVKVVGSSGGWYFNEGFKFFAASAAHDGAKLLDFQHGGGYGLCLSIPHERLCLEKDYFFTWGWAGRGNRIKPLPVPYLSKLKDKYSRSLSNLLFVSTSLPRYQYRLETCMQPEDMLPYVEDKKTFFKELDKGILNKVLFRPNIEGGWNLVERIKSEYPNLPIVWKRKLVDWMKKVKLVVIDHAHTSFLEALVINAPIVLYWDHDVYLMRPEAEEYFELLRKGGILHKSPEAAAEKVNEIWDDPITWWKQDQIQEARNKFCSKFALTSDNWLDDWARELRAVSG